MAGSKYLWSLLYALALSLAILITVATGFVVGNGTEYGFPLFWRTQTSYCIVTVFGGCFTSTTYEWLDFFLDTSFYTAILYGCIRGRVELKRSMVSIGHFLTRLPPRWKELARPFQISAIMGALAGAYSAYSVLPRVIIERALFYSGVSSGDGFSGIFASVLIAIVFLVLFAIPLGGAIALVTLRMSDEERGILALFVTVFSFIPILFLGFQVLGWLLTYWEYAVVGIVWTILVFMAAGILRSRKINGGKTVTAESVESP